MLKHKSMNTKIIINNLIFIQSKEHNSFCLRVKVIINRYSSLLHHKHNLNHHLQIIITSFKLLTPLKNSKIKKIHSNQKILRHLNYL